jgi:DNA-binding MarR family transcriptional regulator
MKTMGKTADKTKQLATEVRRATMRLARRLRSERPSGGASLAQLMLLGRLYREGPSRPGALADSEGLQPQSVTRSIAALEREGWIRRSRDPVDGRQAIIAITAAGRAIVERDMSRRDEWLANAIGAELDAEQRELLHRAAALLERLAES